MLVTLHRRSFAAVMALLALAAWALLWFWQASPYGRYVEHGGWLDGGIAGALCGAIPAGSAVAPAMLYLAAWLVMTTAMMIPTVIPLLEIFRRLVRPRPDRARLLVLVLLGYFLAWATVGLGAHLLDLLIHRLAEEEAWTMRDGWMIGCGLLALAGLYQFGGLKRRCADRCRSPLSFVLTHWRGRHPQRHALLLGLRHGADCVGCCLPLMIVMFAVGTGNLGLMLLLSAVMAAEKNLPAGRWLEAPAGIALLAWAAALAFA